MTAVAVSVLLARQPIFDDKLQVFGYELLYRGEHPFTLDSVGGDSATSQVVMNALCGMNPDEVAGTPIFINLTEAMLVGEQTPPLPVETTVFEILETTRASELVFKQIRHLKQQGFRIALDDFVWRDDWQEMLPLADFIKIDLFQYDRDQLRELVAKLKAYPAALVAEKVETREELEFCRELGCQYFQGFFLEKPQPVVGKKLRPQMQLIMDVYASLQREDITAKELADQIGRDPQLTFQLLRIINSAAFSLQRRIQNLREAIMLLGMQKLRTWMMIIALANERDKPAELLHGLLVRARLAELVAKHQLPAKADAAFLLGMFSGLDALLDIPMTDLVKRLPLHDEMIQALLEHQGPLGQLLHQVIAFEHAEWQEFQPGKLAPEIWQQSYYDALKWARSIAAPLREK